MSVLVATGWLDRKQSKIQNVTNCHPFQVCKTLYKGHSILYNFDTFLWSFLLKVKFKKCYLYFGTLASLWTMEQHPLNNVNNCLNTNIYSYLEISGGQNSNVYLNVVHFFTLVLFRHLWLLKTVVFLHWCLICPILLTKENALSL